MLIAHFYYTCYYIMHTYIYKIIVFLKASWSQIVSQLWHPLSLQWVQLHPVTFIAVVCYIQGQGGQIRFVN